MEKKKGSNLGGLIVLIISAALIVLIGTIISLYNFMVYLLVRKEETQKRLFVRVFDDP